jgi:hypothetical protein
VLIRSSLTTVGVTLALIASATASAATKTESTLASHNGSLSLAVRSSHKAQSSAHASPAAVMPSVGGTPAPSTSGTENNQPYPDEDIEC